MSNYRGEDFSRWSEKDKKEYWARREAEREEDKRRNAEAKERDCIGVRDGEF